MLREGERGDEMVSVEERLITNSLNQYRGKDKDNVARLFRFFAVFPEDVPVPEQVLCDLVSLLVKDAAHTKRPALKVKSWITALLR